eukprot:10587393-Alexandrium_andersonii.AAC.1
MLCWAAPAGVQACGQQMQLGPSSGSLEVRGNAGAYQACVATNSCCVGCVEFVWRRLREPGHYFRARAAAA